jgi:hypothetical protein
MYMPDEKGRFNTRAFKQIGHRTGEILNKYGEAAAGAIKGLLVDGLEVITRLHQWTFSYKHIEPPKASSKGVELFRMSDPVKEYKPPKQYGRFVHWLWDFCSPKREGLSGYPRPRKYNFEPAKLAKLGLV